jgi:hypothetical protein
MGYSEFAWQNMYMSHGEVGLRSYGAPQQAIDFGAGGSILGLVVDFEQNLFCRRVVAT